MSPQPKVLVFTASAKRPIYLRHCLLQMQQQTYPLDHAVYLNSPEYKSPDTDPHNYMSLVDDIVITKGKKIHIGYGPTASHHKNHMAALTLVNWEDYDLFFKVDDDDVYRSTYIQDAVTHFQEHQWDFSGEISHGHILKDSWNKTVHIGKIKQSKKNTVEKNFLAPAFSFSKKSMKMIMGIKNISGPEDVVWNKYLQEAKNIKTMVRPDLNFTYHIHDNNISEPS
ncbi:hypothetical protein OAJ27_01960 [bacterium]|nr:hypothetical protein [bacterium]